MFERMIQDLERLERTEIQIQATGNYPTKRRTAVADVAVYQNDGTATIKPAHFVEKAARARGGWGGQRSILWRSVGNILFHNGPFDLDLEQAGLKISADIADFCKRIRTGRLKASFLPKIKTT